MPLGSDLQENNPGVGEFVPKSGLAYQALRGLKSTLGVTSKAVIEILDFSPKELKENKAPKPGGGKPGFGGFDTSLAAQVAGTLDVVKNIADKANNILGGDDKKSFEIVKKSQKYKFEVPFNPSEITVTGYGGEQVALQNFTGHGLNGMEKIESHIEMNIPLIFDKTNPLDAFYADKFNLSGTNIAKGLATGISEMANAKGKDSGAPGSHSVQPEVEALTYVNRSKDKRLISFTWGDMHFEGVLNSVSAEYTMFNVNGEPCRATVNLRVVLMDSNYNETFRIWRKKYQKRFGYKEDDSLIGQVGALGGVVH